MGFGGRFLSAAALALTLAGCGAGAEDAGGVDSGAARAAEFFLTSNARAAGVVTLESGLQYKVLRSGPNGEFQLTPAPIDTRGLGELPRNRSMNGVCSDWTSELATLPLQVPLASGMPAGQLVTIGVPVASL